MITWYAIYGAGSSDILQEGNSIRYVALEVS